jgi:hypothetical protein
LLAQGPYGAGSSSPAVPHPGRRITASRAEGVAVPCATDPILDAIEGHPRALEQLGRLLAEQDAAERKLRHAPEGRQTELHARLAELCDAEGALGRAEMKAFFGSQAPYRPA